jgi:hypothetical protein
MQEKLIYISIHFHSNMLIKSIDKNMLNYIERVSDFLDAIWIIGVNNDVI